MHLIQNGHLLLGGKTKILTLVSEELLIAVLSGGGQMALNAASAGWKRE